MAQRNKGIKQRRNPKKRKLLIVPIKFNEDKKEDIPEINNPSIIRSIVTGDKLIKEVLNGG